MLADNRWRILGRTSIQSKPRKYGLKIFWACEPSTRYGLNATAYSGMVGNRVHHNLARYNALKVVESWHSNGRDI